MKNKVLFMWLGLLMICAKGWTQELEAPADFLKASFHKERRAALRASMPDNSVAVVFANPVRNRANDVDYIYHQDPNFYYLTGYQEPHGVLLVFSEPQTDANGNTYDEVIFVQPRNARMEMWTGKRLGIEGVKETLGFEHVYENNTFNDFGVDFSAFDKVMFFQFHDDVRDNPRDEGDLYSMIDQFKGKTQYNDSYSPVKQQIYELIRATDFENSANVAQIIGRIERSMNYYPELNQDEVLQNFLKADNELARKKVVESLPSSNLDGSTLNMLMGRLRETKTEEEMVLLKKAVEISCVGQIEVMKAMHPGMSETEIQGIHEFVFKKYGSEYEGYPSIVGAGHNGCVLHYITNNKPKVGNELVLMDLGAEYHGYTADVTRTIPANGKFTPEQKAIYQLVYDAQEAGIKACRAGNNFSAPHFAAVEVINKGLAKLGLIEEGQSHSYFPHGTSHYLGLDVHDSGTRGPFKPNTVITVEPGIYIPENSPCDPKWWGIAVRIEDDILITEGDPVNLSALAPRSVEDIEAMMAQPSPLDDFVLPNLDEKTDR